MRPDMFKVIVERPRGGGGRKFPRGEKIFATSELRGMRRAHRQRKYLRENLAPLERFLRTRVGKHWNKVYAEVCEHLRADSAVQQHVRDHIPHFVALHTEKREDGIYERPGDCKVADTRYEFYVHPISGVLMRNRHRLPRKRRWREGVEREAAQVAERRRKLSPSVQLHKLAGCWFEVTLAAMERRKRDLVLPAGERDAIIDAGLTALSRNELYGRPDVYATSKRQLSKRELAVHGLRND